MEYKEVDFKIPVESDDYEECSLFVTHAIGEIIGRAIENDKNKIIINTNLKRGLPMENINKIAGPIIEAWAFEVLGITAEVDVKATAEDIISSGKSPNITSFARIRCAYIEDPDYIFIILSLKHRVYSTKNADNLMMDGIMEIVGYNVYDLKYVSSSDLNCNPALGYGQIQIKDINYVSVELRTAWEFCQLLDRKYLSSKKRSFENWLEIAKKFEWIKIDE